MKLIVKLKTFEEIASISVPIIFNSVGPEIRLENLAYKNFNNPYGKYLYIASVMFPLDNTEILVDTEAYEDCFYSKKYNIKFGRWLINILRSAE